MTEVGQPNSFFLRKALGYYCASYCEVYKPQVYFDHLERGAFEAAMSAEFVLKYLCTVYCKEAPSTHGLKMMVNQIGRSHIRSDFLAYINIYREYESNTRYSSDYVVYEDELKECLAPLKAQIEFCMKRDASVGGEWIRAHLPVQTPQMSDIELLKLYGGYIDINT